MLQIITLNLRYWQRGVRLYIALGSLLIAADVWWWAATAYGSDSKLFTIRLSSIYAWLSVTYLVTAISIGPVYKLSSKLPGRKYAYDGRRLIGICAAFFASLHIAIAFGVLFKFTNPLKLPVSYQQSFALGSVAMLILLLMVVTSFNKAFNYMGIWWFRLHRLVYIAALAVLAHLFTTGIRESRVVLALLAVVSAGLITAHTVIWYRANDRSKYRLFTISATTAVLISIFIYGVITISKATTG